MAKYLDYEGLQVLWTKIKNKINEGIVASDAMIFKGTIGTGGTVTELPSTTAKTGWTYKVITAGTYSGSKCEIGDMLICLTDGSTSTAATWTVVQANIDGAVTGPASSTASHVAVFNDATGKVIKDSGYTIATSVPSGAVFTDTKYSAGAGISLSGTTFSNSGVRAVKPGTSANQVVVDTNGTNSTITINNVANATNATKATKDSSDQQINTTYIKGATASGNTLTLTKGDNNTVNVTLPLASSTTNGEMSSADKAKLEGIADGAQVNQNSFSNIKVGKSTIASGSTTDTFELAQGSNVTISADAATKKVTIAAKDTTYKAATASADGLMTAADKAKLDGIASGANAYTHPSGSAPSKTLGLYKISTDAQSHVASAVAVEKGDITALGIPAQDTTYGVATMSADGLMSAADKKLLDSYNRSKDSYLSTSGDLVYTEFEVHLGTVEHGPLDNTESIDVILGPATPTRAGLMKAHDKTKLDGIAAGAEVNQNAFSRVTVGGTNIDADNKTDSLTLVAGSNVTITPDATNDKITIAATNTDTKVTQNVLSSNTGYYPLIGANTAIGDPSSAPTTETNEVNKISTLWYSAEGNYIKIKESDSAIGSVLSPSELVVGDGSGVAVQIGNGVIMSNLGSPTKVFTSDGGLMEIQAITTAEINALS